MAIADLRLPERETSVAVLAPLGRDAFIVAQTLAARQITTAHCASLAELVALVRAGVGAVLLTEEAVHGAGGDALSSVLAAQPSWSDLPLLLLLAAYDGPRAGSREVDDLRSARNVTVLQRPVPAITLVTAVEAALRARRRQYEVRNLLARECAAREHAEEATRIKDEFLASISHELRTPLGAILLWSQLLASGRVAADQVGAALEAITRSAEAQARLVEDLLDVSRMLSGKLRLDIQPCVLGPLARAAADIVRPMAEAKGVALIVRGEAGPEDSFVSVDPDRARQVVWNLLSNAVKFTPAAGQVVLELGRESEYVVVTVSDTGEGIPSELLPHVFERFRQGEPASSRRGGLGLGLAIVLQLVEMHGGTVDVRSEGRGRGATFTVRFPVARP